MTINNLHPESARTTPDIDPALFEAPAGIMGLPSSHPDVIARVKREEAECYAMEYAAGAVSAAMDALAALDALNLAELGSPRLDERHRRETLDRLLRFSRRQLRAAVGSPNHPGYDKFLDMISAHGLGIYED
jgi:hypothetical protein